MKARIAKEADSLPEWAKVTHQHGEGGIVKWSLTLDVPARGTVEAWCSFTSDFPFRPPVIQVLSEEDGITSNPILLPCLQEWSPAMRVSTLLTQLLSRLEETFQAHASALAEVQTLRAERPSWLLHVGNLYVPSWINGIESAIGDNVDLDPVCPPGCANFLRKSRTYSITECEQLPYARRAVPFLGPWKLLVVVCGPEGSFYHHSTISRGIRLELTFGHGFPKQPPQVVVLSIMQHLLGASSMPLLFYQTLADNVNKSSSRILGVLQHFQNYLSRPLPDLEKFGLPYAPSIRGHAALERWHQVAEQNYKKLQRIAEYYPFRLHPSIYECGPAPSNLSAWRSSCLVASLVDALGNGNVKAVMEEVAPNVFVFEMFTHSFCDLLLQELEHFERVACEQGWRVHRPNSMNNHGVILNDMGLEAWADALQNDILLPIASQLFPVEGTGIATHHTFLVAYEAGADTGLDMHTDDSEVTFNICLGKEFTGAGMTFCGQMGRENHRKLQCIYRHEKGRCVVHLGRQRHGADDIVEGQRRNLIIWNQNPSFRETQHFYDVRPPHYLGYSKEAFEPDKVCVSYTHDRDYHDALPRGGRRHGDSNLAWCPPEGKSHSENGYKMATA